MHLPHVWLSRGVAVCLAVLTGSLLLAQSDITQPGDPIVASSSNSPGSEGVANAIDNQPTKYLNFDGANNGPTGFTVTPSVGATIVTGLTLQSANDAPERDPATYRLEGSNDGTTFTLVSEGAVPAFSGRFITVRVDFSNNRAYRTYRLTFPTTATSNTCCMQVAEVELLGTVVPPDVTQPGDPVVASSSNSPGSEGVANAIDNQPTKYLNFDGANGGVTGFSVSPSVGATIVTGLTLQSANDAPERDPATYRLEGSNDDGATYTLISEGPVPPFTARFETVQVFFANTRPYKTYRLTFPTTAAVNTCCMQVAEVEFLGTVAPQDVTQPGDPVVASSSNSPGSEGVANAIDNQPTKYLNFDGANNGPTGFTVTPSVGRTIVTGLTLQSANDAPERDPATFRLEGSTDGTTFALIAEGAVPAFTARFQTVEVFFENSTPYTSYRLTFPTTATSNTCCMQVAEVEFLGFSADSGALPQFRVQPVDTPVLVGASARFYVVVNGPWQIQWYRNGELIPGANQLAYTTPPITAENADDAYYAVARNGGLASQSDTGHIRIFTPSAVKSIGVNFAGSGANGAPTAVLATDIGGVHPQAYWNNAAGASGDLPDGVDILEVKNSDNADSGVQVNYLSTGSWGAGTGTDNTDRKLLNGYLDPNGNANRADITFYGVPAGNHSVIIYTVNRPLAFNDSDYSVLGQTTYGPIYIRAQNADEYNATPEFVRGTATTPAARSVANYVRFNNVQPDGSGTITITAQSILEPGETPAGTAPVNAIQLLINPPDLGNPPQITEQPASTNVVLGANATFSVTATGTGTLNYRWRKGGVNLSDGGKISGATTPTLQVTGVTAAEAGAYSVVVSSPAGNATSQSAVLTTYNGQINDRLVGHWKFDETSGLTAANAVPGGEAGVLTGYAEGNSHWVAGRSGGALSFDGFANFVVVPNYTKPTTALTVSAWAWSDSNGDAATIIANAGVPTQDGRRLSQFELGLLGTDGDLRGLIVAGPNPYQAREGDFTTPFPNGSWQHVTLVADGSRVTIYRNGARVGSVDYLGQITDATAPCLGIGGLLDNVLDPEDPEDTICSKLLTTTPGLWTGRLDDIGVWTRALGADEVQKVYLAGQAGQDLSTIPPVTPPADATLSAAFQANGNIVLTYTGVLESAPTITGPWTPVAGATSPYTATPAQVTGAGLFYRSAN